jgi:hypothetical protein
LQANASKSKPNGFRGLSLAFFYFSESRLFKGLRAKNEKTFLPVALASKVVRQTLQALIPSPFALAGLGARLILQLEINNRNFRFCQFFVASLRLRL